MFNWSSKMVLWILEEGLWEERGNFDISPKGMYPLCDQSFRWDVFWLIKDMKNDYLSVKIWVIHFCTLIWIMDICIL